MSLVTGVVILLIAVVVLLMFSVPIGVAFGLTSAIFLFTQDLNAFVIIPYRLFNSVQSFSLTAIPFFLLVGEVMSKGKLAEKMVEFADSLVGHVRGGLAHTNIVASMLFGGISGSAVADTSAVGATLIPMMTKADYTPAFSAAVTAVSSGIGIVIPPSIPMIVLGSLIGVSITDLFLAGIVPGILIGIAEMIGSYFICKKHGMGKTVQEFSLKRVFTTFISALPIMVIPIIIIGGTLFGIFTVTESAAVAAVYSVILVVLIRKEMPVRELPALLLKVAVSTATVTFIMAASSALSWVLTSIGLPKLIVELIASFTTNKYVVLFIIGGVFLLAGCFLEGIAAIIMLAPMFMTTITMFGIDPIHFSIIVVITLAIGGITPPMGIYSFIAARIGNVKLEKLFREQTPFYIILTLVLLLVILVPALLYIPKAILG